MGEFTIGVLVLLLLFSLVFWTILLNTQNSCQYQANDYMILGNGFLTTTGGIQRDAYQERALPKWSAWLSKMSLRLSTTSLKAPPRSFWERIGFGRLNSKLVQMPVVMFWSNGPTLPCLGQIASSTHPSGNAQGAKHVLYSSKIKSESFKVSIISSRFGCEQDMRKPGNLIPSFCLKTFPICSSQIFPACSSSNLKPKWKDFSKYFFPLHF